MVPRYRITLTREEREKLETMTRTGKTSARKLNHARLLLLCDVGPDGPARTVADVAKAVGVSHRFPVKLQSPDKLLIIDKVN